MGRFKNDMQVNPIVELLKSQGFEKRTGAMGEKGYTRTYSVDDGYYTVWVTVNVKTGKVSIYKEYECGGCVGESEEQLSEECLNDVDLFIDELDEILEYWIGD